VAISAVATALQIYPLAAIGPETTPGNTTRNIAAVLRIATELPQTGSGVRHVETL